MDVLTILILIDHESFSVKQLSPLQIVFLEIILRAGSDSHILLLKPSERHTDLLGGKEQGLSQRGKNVTAVIPGRKQVN